MLKDFLTFSRTEKRGIVVLVILIATVWAGNFLLSHRRQEEPNPAHQALFEKEYQEFAASLRERSKSNERLPRRNPTSSYSYAESKPAFKKKEFSKPDSTRRQVTPRYTPAYKYPEGTVINLNTADTTELKKIPGIGGFSAKKIIAYRNKLGGFYKVDQLEEIELPSPPSASWFTVGTADAIRRINLNETSVERLRAHPYFNFYQARAIVEFRKKKGPLHGLKQLALYDEFTPEDFERMEPYVCFE